MPQHPISGLRGRPPASIAPIAALVLLAVALCCSAQWARAADTAAKPAAADATVTVKAFPPSVLVDTKPAQANDANAEDSSTSRRGSTHLSIDAGDDFSDVVEKMPWVIGLIFLVVGSIFLTPVVLVVGIVWYKLRKTRLQNEAMLALAEKGVVPPAQAAEALATSAAPATVAPQVYQQAAALRKRVVWSDLRKGILLTMLGLGSSFYSVTADRSPNWLGLVLIFVGLGYIALWWLEGRQLDRAGTIASNGSAKPGGT